MAQQREQYIVGDTIEVMVPRKHHTTKGDAAYFPTLRRGTRLIVVLPGLDHESGPVVVWCQHEGRMIAVATTDIRRVRTIGRKNTRSSAKQTGRNLRGG